MAKKPAAEGEILLAFHVAPRVRHELKLISVREQVTMKSLIVEALEAIFAKHARARREVA